MKTDSSKEQIWKEPSRDRSEGRRRHENLFFEMSRAVESPEMLKSWVEWFRGLHIPCAIAKTDGGYTLWRKGKEVGRRRTKVPQVLIKENIIFSFGLTGRDLDLLKEKEREEAGDSFEEFVDVPLQVGRGYGEARLETASP